MKTPQRMLITGCSGGLGKALALEAKNAGFRVIATARKQSDVEALRLEGFEALRLDVTDATSIDSLVHYLEADGGELSFLVNNAGFGAMGPVLDASSEKMRQQFETNLFAVAELTQACLPFLRQSQGLVVNIGSVSAKLATPFAGWYCASKAALHSLSDALRMELKPFGVRVLTVQAGAIATSFAKNAKASVDPHLSETSPWWRFRDGIARRANASQQSPTPASELAKKLLLVMTKPKKTGLVRLGHGAYLLALMAALLPRALTDRILSRKFLLNRF